MQKNAEHTWGTDTQYGKTLLPSTAASWDNDYLQRQRLNASSPFHIIEQRWQEQADWARQLTLEALQDHPLRSTIEKALKVIYIRIPAPAAHIRIRAPAVDAIEVALQMLQPQTPYLSGYTKLEGLAAVGRRFSCGRYIRIRAPAVYIRIRALVVDAASASPAAAARTCRPSSASARAPRP